jgi:hypothetical protein
MKRWSRPIVLVVLLFGLVNLALGITFISIGVSKQHYLSSTMKEEKITLGIPDEQIAQGEVIDTMGEAQRAGDVVRGHRHGIAPTYGDLLGGQKFNPGDPKQLTYAQAMNIENYLYLATASFGITYLSIGAGVGLLLGGLALMGIALVLWAWARRTYANKPDAGVVTTTAGV